MTYEFLLDAEKRAKRTNMHWYHENLMPALKKSEEHKIRGVEMSIGLARKLLKALDEPVDKPVEIPTRELVPYDDLNVMRPIEQEVLDLIYKSTTKGFGERYLTERYKKLPEDRFYGRETTSFDYGWQLGESRMSARDVLYGRCALLRDTFYRKNNLAPDPPTTMMPASPEVSACSNYTCYFN